MPVAKITVSADFDFSRVLAVFQSGKMYIGEGSYSRTEAEAAYGDAAAAAAELSSNLTEYSDLAEKPGKIESKAEKLKTKNYLINGKRSTLVELKLVGVTEDRVNWLEQKLNDSAKTVVLEDIDGDNYLIFNGLRWVADWSEELDGLFDVTLQTEFTGKTEDKIMMYFGVS